MRVSAKALALIFFIMKASQLIERIRQLVEIAGEDLEVGVTFDDDAYYPASAEIQNCKRIESKAGKVWEVDNSNPKNNNTQIISIF